MTTNSWMVEDPKSQSQGPRNQPQWHPQKGGFISGCTIRKASNTGNAHSDAFESGFRHGREQMDCPGDYHHLKTGLFLLRFLAKGACLGDRGGWMMSLEKASTGILRGKVQRSRKDSKMGRGPPVVPFYPFLGRVPLLKLTTGKMIPVF